MTTTERPAQPGETCDCGQPARTVYVTENFGDVPYCGVPHDGRRAGVATLAEYLEAGLDPAELKGYRLMLDQLVDMAHETTDEERAKRVAFHRWEPFGDDHYEGPFGGWAGIEEWRTYSERCVELVESEAVRKRFWSAMSEADREDVTRRIAERLEPVYEVALGRGAATACSTCDEELDGADYVRVAERGCKPSDDDITMCMACVRGVLPTPAPMHN